MLIFYHIFALMSIPKEHFFVKALKEKSGTLIFCAPAVVFKYCIYSLDESRVIASLK